MNPQELIAKLEAMGFENIGDSFSVTLLLKVPCGQIFTDFTLGDGKPFEAYVKLRTKVCQIAWKEGPYTAEDVQPKVEEGIALIAVIQEWIEKLESLIPYHVDSLRLEEPLENAATRSQKIEKHPWTTPWQKLKAAKIKPTLPR